MGDDYLTIDEAGTLLQRSVPTVWRLLRQHRLETFRRAMDRRTFVRRADVEQLRDGRFTPR